LVLYKISGRVSDKSQHAPKGLANLVKKVAGLEKRRTLWRLSTRIKVTLQFLPRDEELTKENSHRKKTLLPLSAVLRSPYGIVCWRNLLDSFAIFLIIILLAHTIYFYCKSKLFKSSQHLILIAIKSLPGLLQCVVWPVLVVGVLYIKPHRTRDVNITRQE